MIDDSNRPVYTYHELHLLQYVTQFSCMAEAAQMVQGKEQKLHPGTMESVRSQLETCVVKTHLGLKEKCLAEYEALSKCLKNNERSYAKCTKLIETMQKCALDNELGNFRKK